MSRIATVRYTSNLHSDLTHLQSGNVISTDAPTDNNGRGEAFSPTDLLAASLGACAMTIMGMKAADLGANLAGARRRGDQGNGCQPAPRGESGGGFLSEQRLGRTKPQALGNRRPHLPRRPKPERGVGAGIAVPL